MPADRWLAPALPWMATRGKPFPPITASPCLSATSTPDAPPDPDAPLLPAVARGESWACSQLVTRHLTRLHGVAWRMLGESSEAEDVCQEVFLRAWQQAGQWQSQGVPFGAWMVRVALNLCRDRLRRRRDGPPLEDLDLPDPAPGPAAELESELRLADLDRQVHELPIRQQEALTLCHVQGLSNIQAAAILELSVDALESLLSRARRSLRQRLAGWRIEAHEAVPTSPMNPRGRRP